MARQPHAQPEADPAQSDRWLTLVARQHRANFDLWHIEDEARAPGATDAELAAVKRRVDRTNQRATIWPRNWTAPCSPGWKRSGLPNPAAPLHSESPGLMIDRLSILALKIYHTREEAERAGAPQGTPSAIWSGSPFLRSSAPTWPPAWTRCGAKPSPGRGASSSTAS